MRQLVKVLLISAFAGLIAGCSGDAPADPRTEAPLVRVVEVAEGQSGFRTFSGTVAARVQSDLGFRVPGKVAQRLVDAGQTVRRGELLMRIDPADLQLSAQAQQQAVVAARAQAQQATADEARYRALLGTGAISASSYDQSKAAADAARAQLSAAQAQAQVANNANRYTELFADADGVVVETLAEPGQVVSAGQPVVRLARAGEREAVVYLPETLRPAIGAVARAKLYGDSDTAVPAKLRQLSDAADRITRTYEARYILDGSLASAPLGATVTVEIADGASSASAFEVPIGALFDAGKGPGVWAIEGNPAKAVWRSVKVLGLSDEVAQVTGNVKAGTRVAALGAHLLKEGQVVKPIVEDRAGLGARP